MNAQTAIDCDAVGDLLSKWENKVKKLNLEDPELIPLHYLLALDIEKELDNFSQKTIPQLSTCKELNYNSIVNRFDDIAFKLSIKKLKLATLSKQVDSIFLTKAIRELHYENRTNALFFLDKSLQCNPLYPEALFLKIRLLFEDEEYQECLSFLHTLYYETPLQRKHEIEISNFNMLFYNKLYHTADSLIKKEKATEALELFKILESFCTNMPIEYCNDDYYHGILKSREGVYESYLIIAKVAAERGNKEIEQKFLEYAEEYRAANRDELPEQKSKTVEQEKRGKKSKEAVSVPEVAQVQQTIQIQQTQQVSKPQEIERGTTIQIVQNPKTEEKIKIEENSKPEEKPTPEEKPKVEEKPKAEETPKQEEPPEQSQADIEIITQKYNLLLIEGMNLALDSKFKKAYELLQEAIELEKCDCFPKDERVQTLYNALHKVYSK